MSALAKTSDDDEAVDGRSVWQRLRREEPAAIYRVSDEIKEFRRNLKIGMPKALNMYTLSPFFSAYFEALGINFRRNIIFSDYTDPQMWYKGSRRGSIDQCFPSKVAIAHVHNLIFRSEDEAGHHLLPHNPEAPHRAGELGR